MSNAKTYSLRGKVTKVYEPRTIKTKWGTKEVSDLYLQLDSGAKVKVSFWDTDVSHHEGDVVVISALTFGGKYKDTPQYGTTKQTTISVSKKGNKAVEPASDQPEGAELEAEPTFGNDGAPEEEAPEGAVEETPGAAVPEEEPVETPAPAKRASAAKPAAVAKPKVAPKAAVKPVAAATPGVYVVSAQAVAITRALAHAACDLADEVAPDQVKENPQAYQALFATLFINLGLKDYASKGGRG